MARRVFFSFHYQRDIWRVNQIRSIPNVTGCVAAGFQDGSIWEEAKKKGDAAIKALINKGLESTSVTVVCVGCKTAGRKYINYEIDQSIGRGNGIVAVQVHHLEDSDRNRDPAGAIPARIESNGYKAYKYVGHKKLGEWIEAAAKAAGK
jgi:Thoeris protein ThsB, TIR-like domain